MTQCVGALDSTLIPIWCPKGLSEVCVCRKQFCAVNFQVVVDAEGFITWVSGGRPSSV